MGKSMRMKEILLVLLILFAIVGTSFAMYNPLVTPYYPDKEYFQPEDVKAFFPNPDLIPHIYNSPSLQPDREHFTTHEEMMDYIHDLQKKTDYMQIKIIGESQEGRAIPLLIFSKPSYSEPEDIHRLNKPIVWINALVHGGEVASIDGALVTANKLATTYWGESMLDKVSVLILPMLNPDGAYYYQRRTSIQIDVNRDHLKFSLPETRAMHLAVNAYAPHVAIDAHELGHGVGHLWDREEGLIPYAADFYTLRSTHVGVPQPIRELGDSLFRANLDRDAEKAGLRHFIYFIGARGLGDEKEISVGGDIGYIARNSMGLKPTFSFLVETRRTDSFEDFSRRVQAQVVNNTSIIQTTAENARLVKRTIDFWRDKITELGRSVSPDDVIPVRQALVDGTIVMPMIDRNIGEIVDVEVIFRGYPEVTKTRVRPYAYILPPGWHHIAERLALYGATIKRLRTPVTLNVEAYKVIEKNPQSYYFEGHYRTYVEVEMYETEKFFPQGSYVIEMAQPRAQGIASMLEPESGDSFVTFNLIPASRGNEVPVYRLMEVMKLDAHIIDPLRILLPMRSYP